MARSTAAAWIQMSWLAILVITCSGCADHQYFLKNNLNPLLIPRDDIEPGALIFVRNGSKHYAGNIRDRVPGSNLPIKPFRAILPGEERAKDIKGEDALAYLASMLPMDLSATVNTSARLKIRQIDAIGRSVSGDQIAKLVNSGSAESLRRELEAQMSGGVTPYVVVETYSAKSLSIESDSNTEISLELDVGHSKEIPTDTAHYTLTRTRRNELIISGDRFYVFAVKSALLFVRKGVPITVDRIGIDLTRPAKGTAFVRMPTEPYGSISFEPLSVSPRVERDPD